MAGRISSSTFVGRRADLAVLEAGLEQARTGRGATVLIGGEAGLGKSRLIGELAERAEAAGVTVLIGECLPLAEGEIPYAPLVGALMSLARERGALDLGAGAEELRALLPELTDLDDPAPPTSSPGSRSRLFEQLLGVLLRAARETPLVVVIEDVHWSDRSTRDFLTFLVRRARKEPLMTIFSYRRDEVQRNNPALPFLLELERSAQAGSIQLSPFTAEELEQQVTSITGQAVEPGLLVSLHRRSEGNPFFAEELLAAAAGPEVGLPATLTSALLLRVEDQPADVGAVLRVIAVAGRALEHELLQIVSALPEDRLTAALRQAIAEHLLASEDATARYAFRHALLREAVYADMLPHERQAAHGEFAGALADGTVRLGGDAELAHHLYGAGRLEAGLRASVSAAEGAERVHAYEEALLHYERALTAVEQLGARSTSADADVAPDRTVLLRRAADAASLVGQGERAIELGRMVVEASEQSDVVTRAMAYERLGRYLWSSGRGEEALVPYRRAVELIPAAPATEARAHVLAGEAQILMLSNRFEESAERCAEALELARSVDAAGVEAHVLNTMCANQSERGDAQAAVASAAAAREISLRLGSAEELGRSYVNGSDALDQAGAVHDSIRLAEEGVEVMGRFGSDGLYGDFLRSEIAVRMMRCGRWQESERLLLELLERGQAGMAGSVAGGALALLRAEQGELEAAGDSLGAAEDIVNDAEGSMFTASLVEARAMIELWAGRPHAALEAIVGFLESIGELQYLFVTARLYELAARAHADMTAASPGDERARARGLTDGAAMLDQLDGLISRQSGTPPPRASASRAGGAAELSRIAGSDPGLWEQAGALWAACSDPYLAAYARWRRAEALLSSGADRRYAEALLADAHATAERLGASPLRSEIEALARRARLKLGSSAAAELPAGALERFGLTARELEVLALLGGGLTNREIAAELFISPKTASVHVSRILDKLSVANRAAAAAAAQRLGLTPERP